MDKAKIAKLCNEIEDIACDISQQTMNDIVSAESRMIFDKAKEITAEITEPQKSNDEHTAAYWMQKTIDAAHEAYDRLKDTVDFKNAIAECEAIKQRIGICETRRANMQELIDKHAAYKALKHEADTHMLPESKEAYERSALIIDQMKPDELPLFDERTCENCGSGDMFKYMHENKPSAPDNAAGEFLLYLLEQIPLDTLIAYVAKRKEKEDAGTN